MIPGGINALRQSVIDWVRQKTAPKKGTHATPTGGRYGFQALVDYSNNRGVPNEVTSTTGGDHAVGSRHYMGLAADFVSDDMAQIGRTFMEIVSSMYGLIHNPACTG